MGMFDFLGGIVPKQPDPAEVMQADRDLRDYNQAQSVLRQQSTVEASVERLVREEMERVQKDQAQAKNLNPLQTWVQQSPEKNGDLFPTNDGAALTYYMLRQMAKVPVISSIVQRRKSQIKAFCRRQRHRGQDGFRVAMRDHERAPSTAALKRIAELEAWMETCGDPTQQEDPSFKTFVFKLMDDSLIFDQACAEILLDKYDRPAAILPVDGATIRRAQLSNVEIKKGARDRRLGHYVQVLGDGQIHAHWTSKNFLFGLRNPSTNIERSDYGYPELEQLARMVMYLLQAEFFNAANFTNGVHASGLCVIKSAMNEQSFSNLDKRLRQALAGAHNAHRTMFMQLSPEGAEDVKMIPFNGNNRDMEFSQWMSWLVKVCCFVPGTPIRMADGSIQNIDQVKPGAHVLTHMGRPGRVLNTQVKEHEGELVCIRASGEAIKSTPEHPFYACASNINGHMDRVFEEPAWIKAEDIVAGETYLCVPKPPRIVGSSQVIDLAEYANAEMVNVEENTIRPLSNRALTIKRHIEVTPAVAFVLGLYYAEGCGTHYGKAISFSFHEDEKEYQELAADFLTELGVNPRLSPIAGTKGVVVVANSVVLSHAFAMLFGDKALNKKIPQEVLNAEEECVKAFISGAIAGDGCFCEKTYGGASLDLVTISKEGAEQFRYLLLQLGVFAGLYRSDRQTKKAATLWSIKITGKYQRRIGEWLVGPKANKLDAYLRKSKARTGQGTGSKSHIYETEAYFLVPVSEVWKEAYAGPVYNLEVERDHSYVVNTYSVHNCGLYLMDPSELNFVYGAENQRAALNQDDPTERIMASREQGLRPILDSMSDWFNRSVIWRLDEDFVFEFVGLDAKSPLVQSQLDLQAIASHASVNEVRARHDEPPVEHWAYDIPAVPALLSIVAAERVRKEQQAQQEQQQAQQEQQAALAAQQGQPPPEGEQVDEAAPAGPPEPPMQLPSEYVHHLPYALRDFEGGNGNDVPEIDYNAIQEDKSRNLYPEGVSHEDMLKAAGITVKV